MNVGIMALDFRRVNYILPASIGAGLKGTGRGEVEDKNEGRRIHSKAPNSEGNGEQGQKQLELLGDRLVRLEKTRRERHQSSASKSLSPKQGGKALGIAPRLVIDMLASLLAGGAVGWVLDWWLGSSPRFLLIGLAVGAIVGPVAVVKTALGYRDRPGWIPKGGSDAEEYGEGSVGSQSEKSVRREE